MKLQTNVFPITNLSDFKLHYRLVRVSGLRPDQVEYFQNRQHLEKHLSYLLHQPVLVVERDGVPHLAVPRDVHAVPADVQLVRLVVQLELLEEPYEIDLAQVSSANAAIALRFLRFMLQAPLSRDDRLWQPAAGRPFFVRTPARAHDGVEKYFGFKVRPMLLPGGLGLCVDTTSCYVSSSPLPADLSHDQFVQKWKNSHCVYRFGHRWYQIQARARADRSVADYAFVVDGRRWSLLDFVRDHTRRPLPIDLANLTSAAAVVTYVDNRGVEKGAPAPLCYPVIDTSRAAVARQHGDTILAPAERRRQTIELADKYLQQLSFGAATLRISHEPSVIDHQVAALPELRFGNGVTLKSGGPARIGEYSKNRLRLLRDRAAGSFVKGPFDRQYLLLPRSVADAFGPRFLSDLSNAVAEIVGDQFPYAPQVVPYDDSCKRTFAQQGPAIRAAIEAGCGMPGYALVMIHRTTDRYHRDEDQLAAMVTRELYERDIHGAVIHSDTASRSYREVRKEDGRLEYEIVPASRTKLSGYLRNVALSKVLLTNQKWPFTLETPLHADVTVGIDVKLNTCGMLVVADRGRTIRSYSRTSQQRERLLPSQMTKYLCEILRDASVQSPVSSFVLHRDGRVFASEIAGIRAALSKLQSEGIVTQDCRWAVLQISKTGPAPLRLYQDVMERGQTRVDNPTVGTIVRIGDSEAYVCSTGAPLLRNGTANPLHVEMVAGNADFQHCLEDLYALTALTWTQPDGCSRQPITISLNDRILSDRASDYNADLLEFEDSGGDTASSEEVA